MLKNQSKLNKTRIKLYSKSVINSSFLDDRIKRFIRNTTFDSKYISLIIKISANNETFWRTIDRRTIINIENKNDVNNYISKLIRYTNTHIEDWYNSLKPEYLHFEWINASEKHYNIYKNNLIVSNLYKKLDINIKNPLNLPFNIAYDTWGDSILMKNNETIIVKIVKISANCFISCSLFIKLVKIAPIMGNKIILKISMSYSC